MQIRVKTWIKYKDRLANVSKKAVQEMEAYLKKIGGYGGNEEEVIRFAYALGVKYGEAAAAAACEMYDAVAAASNAGVPPADPADVPSIGEMAKAVKGTVKNSSESQIPKTVGRLVKRTGADTTLKNAGRDGAQFAWVPMGDTCAFCIALASRGWQFMSKKALKNGHAEHIHANCDCQYAIRFDDRTTVEGYDPEKYRKEWDDAPGSTWKEKLRYLRWEHDGQNRERINAQKRAAYEKRKIAMPIESRHSVGKPPGIALFGDKLSKKQQKLLTKLQKYDEKVVVSKRSVSMKDLAALTAHEGVEFAMFTRKGKRLIIRGGRNDVNIDDEKMKKLAQLGYRWSGHTHPVTNLHELVPSPGDRNVLRASGKNLSVIYSSTGRKYVFGIDEKDDLGYG